MKTRLLCILLMIVLASIAVYAAPPANLTAQGGNITKITMTSLRQTDHWQGLAGQVFFSAAAPNTTAVNAVGSFVNGTNINFTIDCDNPISASGFIFFSNASTPPSGLTAGDLSILDRLTGNKSDSGAKTFTSTSSFAFTSGTITGVPTAFSFVSQAPQSSSFREGYFNQGANIVFATVIEVNLTGYNSSFFDYQALLVAPYRTTIPYSIFADINFTCPAAPGAPPGAGGGSGGQQGGCIVFWHCDPWEACESNGFQHRTCTPASTCPNQTGTLRPPSQRVCIPREPREELPETISEREILWPGFLGNLTLNLTPDDGYILEEKELHGTFQNRNDQSLEGITYVVTTPRVYTTFAPTHTAPLVLWNTLLSGWTDHGHAEDRAFDWIVVPPAPLPRLAPHTTEPYRFTVIPPVMQPKTVDIGVSAYSGPVRVKSTIAPLTVDVRPFQIAGEWRPLQNVLVLYYVVDNRGRKGKSINIEVDLNHGKSTLIAELLGPLRVPADSVGIYGHEYRLGRAARGRDIIIDARLYAPDGNHRAMASFATR